MRALQLCGDRDLRLVEVATPEVPYDDWVQLAPAAVALNHIDVWGFRGMAFAKRKLPLTVGAEASGVVTAVGPAVSGFAVGDEVVSYGALTCGRCRMCLAGRDNLCEHVAGVMGFHIDGFAAERICVPARLLVKVPAGVTLRDASCATVTFGTVQHMLFDNARLEPGETILIQAGGSGIGTVAIRMAKAIGCTVITTVGSDEKLAKVLALGADHAINYTTDRFEGAVRKITAKKGVDVVFEHVGATTWEGSLFSLRPGGRLVTCGSTSGVTAQTNLMQLFQRQLRIIGSFGCTIRNVAEGLEKMRQGIVPVLDTVVPLGEFGAGLERLEGRSVFGKVLVTL
jgi:NADPH:quinone reductase-like Zn-dependent oxidoreductase